MLRIISLWKSLRLFQFFLVSGSLFFVGGGLVIFAERFFSGFDSNQVTRWSTIVVYFWGAILNYYLQAKFVHCAPSRTFESERGRLLLFVVVQLGLATMSARSILLVKLLFSANCGLDGWLSTLSAWSVTMLLIAPISYVAGRLITNFSIKL